MATATCKDCGNQISTAAKACPHCGRPVQQIGLLGGCAAVALILLIGVFFFPAHEASEHSAASMSPPPAPSPQLTSPEERDAIEAKNYAQENLKVTHADWSRGGFDTALIADLTVRNDGDRDVKDVHLTCATFGETSDTPINRPSMTLYETIRAHKSKRFHEVNLGYIPEQVQRAACTADNAVLK